MRSTTASKRSTKPHPFEIFPVKTLLDLEDKIYREIWTFDAINQLIQYYAVSDILPNLQLLIEYYDSKQDRISEYYLARTKILMENRDMLDSVSGIMTALANLPNLLNDEKFIANLQKMINEEEEKREAKKQEMLRNAKRIRTTDFEERIRHNRGDERRIDHLVGRLNKRIAFFDERVYAHVHEDDARLPHLLLLRKNKRIAAIPAAPHIHLLLKPSSAPTLVRMKSSSSVSPDVKKEKSDGGVAPVSAEKEKGGGGSVITQSLIN